MRTFHKKRGTEYCPSINIDRLWSMIPKAIYDEVNAESKVAPVVDVTKLGYFKVLGKGKLPDKPLVVKARFVSSLAEKKIKAAGGAVILTA